MNRMTRLSLAPGFSRVFQAPQAENRFNGFSRPPEEAAEAAERASPSDTRLKPGANERVNNAAQTTRTLASLLLALLAGGCATRPELPRTARAVPADALITQRAVLTARARQFTLNGYLSLSEARGKRLIITENFGNVLADVLVKPDGTVHVMRASSAFPRRWIKRYIASDLQCIFGGPVMKCPGRMLSPTRFVIERFWYQLDLQIVEIKPGPQPPAMFDETTKATR